ncbi:MAG: glycosyltransferase family 4 protein [Actinomycetia bacterium]|nr:glycosyltransferase family 4 protein [Actinomycetes bacterium]
MTLRVAYLVSRYPAVSHTFIQREVTALRATGAEVHTFSVRAAAAADALSAADRDAAATTTALLPASPADLLHAALDAARHPGATRALLAHAFRRGRGEPRATLWQLFYAAEALLLWRRLRARDLRHVHTHFANVSADVARLTTRFGNAAEPSRRWTWSFTMHGPTELADVRHFDLAAKVAEADYVVCISDYCRSQLLALVDEPHWDKLGVVHCGVDPSRFEPVARPGTGPLEVLCVGRLVPEKGQEVLLRAVADLTRRGIDVRATFVGDGPRRAALEKAAAEAGITDRVTFTGSVGQDDIRRHYDAADVFCLPSFAEGVPVVLMEAMASGLPVVTTRITGVPELVEHGTSGVLVPPGRADALADALAELAADAARRNALGVAGRRMVEAEFEVTASARLLAEHLAEVVGQASDTTSAPATA